MANASEEDRSLHKDFSQVSETENSVKNGDANYLEKKQPIVVWFKNEQYILSIVLVPKSNLKRVIVII